MRFITKSVTLLILLSVFNISRADEGMWLINLLDKNLTQKMRASGLKIDPKIIYDEQNVSISNAVVALDFGCTGSMISKDGLLITNHHCAYSDIHALSTPAKNYLEDGFWAMNREQEVPIKGKSVFFLRKVIDVTAEIKSLIDSLTAAGKPSGMRKIYSYIEEKHKKESGYETSCNSMWKGSKYYMYYYDVYTDIRLVGAPPVSIAAYGGETDNWEWPQHKGDFAMYRVYADKNGKPAPYSVNNVPMTPKKVLTISTAGVKEGDFTMVIGFPGRTNRYGSSFEVAEKENVTNPIMVKIRRERLNIMKKWMETDPEIRLKYADEYFGISNYQELLQGEILNFRRYGVVAIKQKDEKNMQEWIDQNPERAKKWGNLLSSMATSYSNLKDNVRALQYFRETLVSGKGFIYLGNRINSLKTAVLRKDVVDSLIVGSNEYKNFVNSIEAGYAQSDMRVEKDLLMYQLKMFIENTPKQYWGQYISSQYTKSGNDTKKMSEYIITNSIVLNPEKFRELIKKNQPINLFLEDPCFLLSKSSSMEPFNEVEKKIMGKQDIFTMESQYGRLLYQMREDKQIVQYPDANSTMRLTYGTVGPIYPSDGIKYSAQSTTQGLIDKFNPDDYEFNQKPRMQEFLKTNDWGKYSQNGKMYVNFLSSNDITGGNSGSPVLNAKGELIGLAFDGNKESLAGDAYFHPNMNKTISVDIRYVLWVIDKYAGAEHLIKEINFSK